MLKRTTVCGGLAVTTLSGAEVHFINSQKENCTNCKHRKKKIFRKKYFCGFTLGLNLDDCEHRKCIHYEKESM